MTVSVLIPYRSSCPHRERALEWVLGRWRAVAPDCEIVVGSDGSDGWRKGKAIRDALERSSGELLAVTDADVWCDRILEAIAAAAHALWVSPHRPICRLNEEATAKVYAGEAPAVVAEQLGPAAFAEFPYSGKPGGGIVIISRESYEACPMDERFVGWGGEDESWGVALDTLLGPAMRFPHPLWHLWHPPAPRRNRHMGSEGNQALRGLYFAAFGDRARIGQLIGEGQLVEHSEGTGVG
jgi:hypothetical protein